MRGGWRGPRGQTSRLLYVPPSKGCRPAGESPARASRQGSPVVKSPVSRREAEPKGDGTKLQAVRKLNSAASKRVPVRDRAGRARPRWAKAVVGAWDSGAACVLKAVVD